MVLIPPCLADSYTCDVPVFVVGAIALLVLTAMAWVVRAATVAAFSTRRPHAAALVTRYWVWFPVLITGIVVSVVLWPVGPFLAAGAIGLVVAKPDLFGLPPR
jgi:hypothetical protein